MKTWQWLGYLGLLPFFLSLAISLSYPAWDEKAVQFFIFYSAIILSFLAGTLWNVEPVKSNSTRPNVLKKTSIQRRQIISNLFCLIALSALLVQPLIALVVLACSYIALFLFEESVTLKPREKTKYLSMRFNLTITVVLMHVITLFFWA